MAQTLPPALVAAVREGRAVLFLGAGASRGAVGERGTEIPTGDGLADYLRATFLGEGYEQLNFKSVYDLACSQRDVRTVQSAVYERLNSYYPASFQSLVTQFAWAGIATTNYDLVVERAYARASRSIQKLVPYVKDGDGSTDRLGDRTLLYVKLHGCLTRYQEVQPPFIASTEQLIAFKEGRRGQFDTFLEWAKTKTLIFAGYAFLDDNLRTLFDAIVREGDNRPIHYIANKGARPAEATYWQHRRVNVIDTPFKELMEALDAAISPNDRKLASTIATNQTETSFLKFITKSDTRESEDLRNYLGSFIDHVGQKITAASIDPAFFYRGFDLGWSPLLQDLDVRQSVIDEIINQHIAGPVGQTKPSLVILKGHAGSGKTVALRRVCLEAAIKHDRLCFFVGRRHLLQPERFLEIFVLTNLPIYLFIDNVSDHKEPILELLEAAARRKVTLRIFGSETYNIWNVSCDELERYVSASHEMRYLSEKNILVLIEKLEKHKMLRILRIFVYRKTRTRITTCAWPSNISSSFRSDAWCSTSRYSCIRI